MVLKQFSFLLRDQTFKEKKKKKKKPVISIWRSLERMSVTFNTDEEMLNLKSNDSNSPAWLTSCQWEGAASDVGTASDVSVTSRSFSIIAIEA